VPERQAAGRPAEAAALAAQWRRMAAAGTPPPELGALGRRLLTLVAAAPAPAGRRPLDLVSRPDLLGLVVAGSGPGGSTAEMVSTGEAALGKLLCAGRPARLLEATPGPVRLSDWCSALAVVTAAELAARRSDEEAAELVEPALLRVAVRFLARAFAARAPGRAVELRVPPMVAVQCLAGPAHTRGTPPNVVEVTPLDWLRLGVGQLGWPEAVRAHRLRASGARADLGRHLPVLQVPGDTLDALPAERNR
jgi:hypothetical protein